MFVLYKKKNTSQYFTFEKVHRIKIYRARTRYADDVCGMVSTYMESVPMKNIFGRWLSARPIIILF